MLLPLFVHPDIFPVKRGAQTAVSFSMSSSDNVPRSSRPFQASQSRTLSEPRGAFLPEGFSSSRLWHERSPEVLKTACSPTQLQNNDVGLRARAFQKETSALWAGGSLQAARRRGTSFRARHCLRARCARRSPQPPSERWRGPAPRRLLPWSGRCRRDRNDRKYDSGALGQSQALCLAPRSLLARTLWYSLRRRLCRHSACILSHCESDS